MAFNVRKAGERLKVGAGVAGDKMRIFSQTVKEKTYNGNLPETTANPQIVQLHNSIRCTNTNLKILQKASKQAAFAFEDFKKAQGTIATALGTLGNTEAAPLSVLCTDISSVLSRLSGLLDMKAKDMSRVETPVTQFQTNHIKAAKEMKARYDKLRIQVEATNKQRVVEANLDQTFEHMTESTLYKLSEVEARKQFEIADVCCDMVTDHINFLSRSLTILKELEPKLQQAKLESQQRRLDFEERFNGPPVSEPALTISTVDRQSHGLPPLQRSGSEARLRNGGTIRSSTTASDRTRVFGVELTSLLNRGTGMNRPMIPPFVTKAIQLIEDQGLNEEGLFRISGNKATMDNIQQKIDAGTDYNLSEVSDVHCVAGLLKQYVRSLPGGLIHGKAQARFLAASSIREEHLVTDYFAVMLPASMTPDYYALLKGLMLHCNVVVQHKETNKMNEANMATVWGPNLVAMMSDPMCMQSNELPELIKILIRNAPTIFDDGNVRRAGDTYEGKAGYDLKPRSAVELELQSGDSLFVFRTHSPDWVYAENKGVVGLVPVNYITL